MKSLLKDKIIRVRSLEEQIKREVAVMKAQVNNALAMVETIHQYDSAYVPPWLIGNRIYKVKNAKDAVLAVLPDTDTVSEDNAFMHISEIPAAVHRKFGTTYSDSTIIQAVYSAIRTEYTNEEGHQIGGVALDRRMGSYDGDEENYPGAGYYYKL